MWSQFYTIYEAIFCENLEGKIIISIKICTWPPIHHCGAWKKELECFNFLSNNSAPPFLLLFFFHATLLLHSNYRPLNCSLVFTFQQVIHRLQVFTTTKLHCPHFSLFQKHRKKNCLFLLFILEIVDKLNFHYRGSWVKFLNLKTIIHQIYYYTYSKVFNAVCWGLENQLSRISFFFKYYFFSIIWDKKKDFLFFYFFVNKI